MVRAVKEKGTTWFRIYCTGTQPNGHACNETLSRMEGELFIAELTKGRLEFKCSKCNKVTLFD